MPGGGVIFYVLSNYKFYIYTSFSIYMCATDWVIGYLTRIIIGIISAYAVYHTLNYVRRTMSESMLVRAISSVSNYSVGIYFFQCLFFYIYLNFIFIDFEYYSFYRVIVLFVGLLGCCFALSFVCGEFYFTRKFVLGKK